MSPSLDEEYGYSSKNIRRVIDGDDFIRNLWDIHLKVKAEGYVQVLAHATFFPDFTYYRETKVV